MIAILYPTSWDPGSGWERFGRTPWSSLKQSMSCSYSAQGCKVQCWNFWEVKLLDSPHFGWLNYVSTKVMFQQKWVLTCLPTVFKNLNHQLVVNGWHGHHISRCLFSGLRRPHWTRCRQLSGWPRWLTG